MATNQSPTVGAAPANSQREQTINESNSPILPSDSEFDSNQEQQPPTRSPTPSPPPPGLGATSALATATIAPSSLAADAQATRPANRTLHVPAALRRNTSTFVPFSEIPSLPAFLNNCNLSQYLQSFNEAGASDDAMPLIIDFDDDELKSIMDAIPMKPFHAVTFRKGIRDLRERSRLGSMHFDNPQSSFMQPEPHSMLQYSHSQFFQQHSQHSQPSQHSQSSQSSQQPLNLSQSSRGYNGGSFQAPGLYHQASTTGKSSNQRTNAQSSAQGLPTPSQVLSSGGIYQYVGPAPRGPTGHYLSHSDTVAPQESLQAHRASSSLEAGQGVKRRRSSTPEDNSQAHPEPSSFNSNSSSSWSNTPNQTSQSAQLDPATRELIMHQALIYGKHSSRSLTKYEHAINCAAQNLALEDSGLLTNKGLLWNKAKAKLLEEDYHYKRGKSRSKLPEAAVKKDHKASKERLIQKREANASNAATARLRRIASLGEQLHCKTAEREALLAQLLRLEAAEYKIAHADTYEAEAKELRENLARVEANRESLSKELGSLKNKERKHQWYEKRKKVRTDGDPSEVDERGANAGTDAEADEEAETDTTVDPEGDASQKSLTGKPAVATAAGTPSGTKTEPKPLTWKAHQPTLASLGLDGSKATSTRSKKRKDIFRPSEHTPGVQG
ncbi:hypothetical protein EC957_006787 [Mortierella hygrophila]|uniref:Uncharacterized protein n=1 Tax=Mortierella hygrophila TaxID=979708 RepID=A0A9P6K674_9FUNG|nr:hypothetical protein EC957_006787 [Mortierella hygrophila]